MRVRRRPMRPGEEGFERTGVGKRVANRRGG